MKIGPENPRYPVHVPDFRSVTDDLEVGFVRCVGYVLSSDARE